MSLVLLGGTLGFAMVRPRGLPEAVVAVPVAGVVLALGLATPGAAWERVREILPTMGFLAAILLVSHLAASEGVFSWLGSELAEVCRGEPRRLMVLTFGAAAGVTAVLSLDATVVLLTPVVLATAERLRLESRPHEYACAHLANSASTLLPVSNLTNLLAYAASGLTFAGFTALMALPWLVTLGLELAAFAWFFRKDLAGPRSTTKPQHQDPPVFALVVLGLMLVGFGVGQFGHVEPVWIAALAALVLGAKALSERRIKPWQVVTEASPLLILFVLALAVTVEALDQHGLGPALRHLLPATAGLPELLAATAVAAVLANLVNNLPATLLVVPMVAPLGATAVLALLVGINVGSSLTWTGSLANLLWRRTLRRHATASGSVPASAAFHRVSLTLTPVSVLAAVVVLWAVS